MFPNLDWYQRRVLPPHGRADRDVHAAVRDRAHHRLERARHRAARGRQDHPPGANYIGPENRKFVPLDRAASEHRDEHDRCHVDPRLQIRRSGPSPTTCSSHIADYTQNYQVDSAQAYETARYCLMDTLACGFQALKYPACTQVAGPGGARRDACRAASRVPGTSYELDPVMGAFNIGAMVRWLDFNDTWLAAEWGHPSDNLGAILAVAGLSVAPRHPAGRKAAHGARRAHRHDQGARDPGRAGAGEQLQPRGPRSRAAGARRLDGGGHRDARRLAASRSSMRSRMPGSTAARCAPIATRPTPARARAGRRAMPPAARCATRCSRSRTRWAIHRR